MAKLLWRVPIYSWICHKTWYTKYTYPRKVAISRCQVLNT
jgi:hypothetical protein